MHLFELEDQAWFPATMRDAGTGYISQIVRITGMMSGVIPLVERVLEHTESNRIIDLCSGAGGPAGLMIEGLTEAGHDVTVHCSDLFPNRPALEHTASGLDGRMSFETDGVDATAVPPELDGLRTVFNAFHHFQPPVAKQILEDAVRNRQPIAVFEFVGREWHTIPGMFGLPFAVMAILPTVRPFRWIWVPLTYLLPIIPLFVVWDGLVSCLRVYSPPELDELTADLTDFDWESGLYKLKGSPGHGTYLLGTPRVDAD